jgi:hypothetical protein
MKKKREEVVPVTHVFGQSLLTARGLGNHRGKEDKDRRMKEVMECTKEVSRRG